jgi:hypothetical protein
MPAGEGAGVQCDDEVDHGVLLGGSGTEPPGWRADTRHVRNGATPTLIESGRDSIASERVRL